MKTCETCRHAIYDHEEYFGSPAGRLSDCRKIDEMTEGEAEVSGLERTARSMKVIITKLKKSTSPV